MTQLSLPALQCTKKGAGGVEKEATCSNTVRKGK